MQRFVFVVIILTVIVIGGIAYVHYVYLPQTATQNNTSATPSNPSVATPTTTPNPTTTQTTNGSCADNDLNCFIVAAQTCTPANVEWTQTINLFDFFNQTSQVHLALNGLNSAGKCSFSERTDNLTLSITTQTEQAAKAKGKTDAQIQQQLQAAQTQAQQQSVGTKLACTLSTNVLVQVLKNWSKGTFSSSDLASGDCTATLPNGTKAPLSTGSSIPLITTGSQQQTQQSSSNNSLAQTATAPSGIGTMTVYLYAHKDSSTNGVEFKVNDLNENQLNVTVTDHSTGQSQTVILTPNNPMIVAGHDMMVTSIQNVSNGTVNGQSIYNKKATLNYK